MHQSKWCYHCQGHHVPLKMCHYGGLRTPSSEKRGSALGRACSFPIWPKFPTDWGVSTRTLCKHNKYWEWSRISQLQDNWGCKCPFSLARQWQPLQLSWREVLVLICLTLKRKVKKWSVSFLVFLILAWWTGSIALLQVAQRCSRSEVSGWRGQEAVSFQQIQGTEITVV